jgi:hypothetical protein
MNAASECPRQPCIIGVTLIAVGAACYAMSKRRRGEAPSQSQGPARVKLEYVDLPV